MDVLGAQLLDELHRSLSGYVIFPSPEAADAVVLWVAATHAQTAWEHATRLAVISPEKRCGKSRLLDVVEATSYQPLITVSISTAALVRSITADPPTLLLDESDTVFGAKTADNNEDLRGILNAGHQRNRPYIRWDPTTRTRETCPTFAMAALAGIGNLPDTIMDRAVVVRMRRRAPGETVRPYRQRRDGGPLADLRGRLTKWLAEHLDALEQAEPDLPIEDRAADTWESLVAVADLAGGTWPPRARAAAVALVGAESESDLEGSVSTRLLADIRDTFTDMTATFLGSDDLVARLRRIPDAPWNEPEDRPLTARRLSNRLRPYGIRPAHNNTRSNRGYHLEDFAEAFARYLPSGAVLSVQTTSDLHEHLDGSNGAGRMKRPAADNPSTRLRSSQPDGRVGTDPDGSLPTNATDTSTATAHGDSPWPPPKRPGGCAACGQPLTITTPGQTTHPTCDPEGEAA